MLFFSLCHQSKVAVPLGLTLQEVLFWFVCPHAVFGTLGVLEWSGMMPVCMQEMHMQELLLC